MKQRRRPVHKPWTAKNRIHLCLLRRSYERKHIAPIWSHIFRTQLSIEGFTNGIPATTLDAQWQELKNGGGGYETFIHISNATQDLIEREYKAYLQEIRQAIQDLGLGITFRTSERYQLGSTYNGRRLARRREVSPPVMVVTDEGSPFASDANIRFDLGQFMYQNNPYSTEKAVAPAAEASGFQGRDASEDRIPPILRINTDHDGQRTQPHPLILFRATPIINEFVSREFTDHISNIQSPPLFGSPDFKDIVWPHLQRNKSYKSPFISLAQNPRNALRRVEIAKSEEPDKEIFLVVFSFNDLHADSQRKFGPRAGPYLVRSLFSAKEVSDLPDGYKGSGEWLLYGSIGCDPIAILDSSQAIKLAKALRYFKSGDAAALLDIHKSLQPVPSKWKEAVSYNLLHRYCGRSHLPDIGSYPYKLLMRVIYDGRPSALARLVAQCERSTTEDVESRQSLVSKDGNVTEGEGKEELSEERSPVPIASVPTRFPVKVNVPSRLDLSSRLTVARLNALTGQGSNRLSPLEARTRPLVSTPMWSTDSESEDSPQAGSYNIRAYPAASKFGEDWDVLDNDLPITFAEQSSAEKKSSYLIQARSLDIIPSVEHGSEVNTFTSQLLRSAYAVSPDTTFTRSPRAPAKVNRSKGGITEAVSDTNSAASSFIDLTDDVITENMANKSRTPAATSTQKRLFAGKGSDEDEDVVIIGSGRRQRVQLPLRSLSVQDTGAVAGEEDFMTTWEVL